MGTDIRIVIEFDSERLSPYEPVPAPFADDVSVWDLKYDKLGCGAKDYRFYAALSGMRAQEDDPPPLFEPRGLPDNAHYRTRDIFTEEDDVCGWLLAHEVRAAIAHLKIPPEHLSTDATLLLQVLELLESRCGPDRVRIVFGYN